MGRITGTTRRSPPRPVVDAQRLRRSARVFVVADSGDTRVTYTVAGASAEDSEDMSTGPGPVAGESYLYVGDIGDNGADRDDIVVHRIPAPTVAGAATQTLDGADALRLRHPDGPRNAEALFVDQRTGALYIIEKSGDGGPVDIFQRSRQPRRGQYDRARTRRRLV